MVPLWEVDRSTAATRAAEDPSRRSLDRPNASPLASATWAGKHGLPTAWFGAATG
jgi:hypothetical protein